MNQILHGYKVLEIAKVCGVLVGILCWMATSCSAHEGPPFPVCMDEPVGDYRMSLWADPDIGEARFFVVLEDEAGDPIEDAPQVVVWTEPTSGRLERKEYEASSQKMRDRAQFLAQPFFDQRDMWQLGIELRSHGEVLGAYQTEIESTPPGLGPWDMAIYLFPFVLLGTMWLVALRRRSVAVARLKQSAIESGESSVLREQV